MPPEYPSTRLLLVRHAQAGGPGLPYGRTATLTPRGHEQAQRLAQTLAPASWPGADVPGTSADAPAIYSSPYRRALETASPTLARLAAPLREDERLAEFQLGVEEEQSIEQIVEDLRYLMLWHPHDQCAAHSETLAQFQTRVSAFLEEVVQACLGRAVVIFTHAGTVAAAMRWAYGLTPDHDWHSDVEIYNASITEIQYWPNGRHPEGAPHAAAIRRLNDVRHLAPDLVTEF